MRERRMSNSFPRKKMRPRGMWRVVLWSEVYLAAALAANALTGGNYGRTYSYTDYIKILSEGADPL